jgi:hypothetical protein
LPTESDIHFALSTLAAPPVRLAAPPVRPERLPPPTLESLRIEGRSEAKTIRAKGRFGAGIRWQLQHDADEKKGGYIVQHVTREIRFAGKKDPVVDADFWELWRVARGQRVPEDRPTTQKGLAEFHKKTANFIADLDKNQAKLNPTKDPKVAAQLAALVGALRIVNDIPGVIDDFFVMSLTKGMTEVTIKGEAFFIDGIEKTDLPEIFTPGGAPAAGILLSAPYKGNEKVIDAFLAKHEKTTSAKVTQYLKGYFNKFGQFTVEGDPQIGTLPQLKLKK